MMVARNVGETYWPEIKAMEDRLENGYVDELITFIRVLKKNGLLDRHMFHMLCDSGGKAFERWDLLHKFAKSKGIE